MKIWLVRDECGSTKKAFRLKKDAVKYADKKRLREWHKGETDGFFDGIECVEVEK